MWRGIPFRLHESDLPLTIPEELHMHTSERAAERGTFNKAVEHKWKAIEVPRQCARKLHNAQHGAVGLVASIRFQGSFPLHAGAIPSMRLYPGEDCVTSLCRACAMDNGHVHGPCSVAPAGGKAAGR